MRTTQFARCPKFATMDQNQQLPLFNARATKRPYFRATMMARKKVSNLYLIHDLSTSSYQCYGPIYLRCPLCNVGTEDVRSKQVMLTLQIEGLHVMQWPACLPPPILAVIGRHVAMGGGGMLEN